MNNKPGGIGGMPGQIISELGQIAKDVGSQAAQIPKDIAGKALESLGGTGGKSSGQAGARTQSSEGVASNAWDQIHMETNRKVKREMARRALEALLKREQKREPSIWERLQMEQEQKKEQMTQQKNAASMQNIPMPAAKRARGDLYGAKAKKTSTENRNVRQD